MEFNITKFFNEASPKDYSSSVAEIGDHAWAYTWQAACDDSADWLFLDTEEKREAFLDYVKGFGAWTEEEIKAWTDMELNALFIQFISGEIRETGLSPDSTDDEWSAYRDAVEAGRLSGDVWRDDMGEIYVYIGN